MLINHFCALKDGLQCLTNDASLNFSCVFKIIVALKRCIVIKFEYSHRSLCKRLYVKYTLLRGFIPAFLAQIPENTKTLKINLYIKLHVVFYFQLPGDFHAYHINNIYSLLQTKVKKKKSKNDCTEKPISLNFYFVP